MCFIPSSFTLLVMINYKWAIVYLIILTIFVGHSNETNHILSCTSSPLNKKACTKFFEQSFGRIFLIDKTESIFTLLFTCELISFWHKCKHFENWSENYLLATLQLTYVGRRASSSTKKKKFYIKKGHFLFSIELKTSSYSLQRSSSFLVFAESFKCLIWLGFRSESTYFRLSNSLS